MAYFWRCPNCNKLYTFADDEDPECGAIKCRQMEEEEE